MTDTAVFVEKATILVVDDTPDNLSLMSGLLKDDYKVKVANGGDKAIKIVLSDTPPDLILLDIMMPEIDGYEVIKRLKANHSTAHIPVIFLTAKSDVDDETTGLELGAVDYITKPITPAIVLARVKTHLNVKRMQDFLRNQNEFLEMEVIKRTHEVEFIQDVTIRAMALLAETRDIDTGKHLLRTQHYVKRMAEKLHFHPRFTQLLNDKAIDILVKSVPLHDIGKVGIPDHILLNPGELTPEEFEIMKTHTTLGRDALVQAEQDLGVAIPYLKYAQEIALSHHEKWDGSGYPEGLSGDDIPVAARLMAVADSFDTLISRRIYSAGLSCDQAMQVIAKGKGIDFDPDIVEVFLGLHTEVQEIALLFCDSDADIAKKIDYLYSIATPA